MNIDKLLVKEPSLEFAIPVLKFLKDPESVSQNELEKNRDASYVAAASASYAAAVAAAANDVAAAASASYVADDYAADAERWINRYFDEISLTREEVEAELFKGEK